MMNTHAEKLAKNTSKAVANAVTQNKETAVTFQLKDNRPEAITQLKTKDTPETMQLKNLQPSFPVVQLAHKHAVEMAKRGRFKRSLKTAIRRIEAISTSGPADEEQIKIHDKVLHSGQHHGMRNVSVQKLIGDLNEKIDELTLLNLKDSDDN